MDAGEMVVLIGAEPPTEWLPADLALDDEGFVLSGPALGSGLESDEAIRAAARIRRQGSPSARWIAADALRELQGPAVEARLR